MSEKVNLEVKYRTWHKGVAPRHIKLEIPGWAGENKDHSDGSKPQPWHCPPFVDGSTYGLELIYPFKNETRVTRKGDEIIFDGDFSDEEYANNGQPPFLSFSPDHYGMTSSLDIMPPEGYLLRIEPHPRFYTDRTGTVPIAAAGHIQRWWSRIFFVAFKSPLENEVHIFRQGEPYAHALIIPDKPSIKINKMSPEEVSKRHNREQIIANHGSKIAKNNWKDHKGMPFNDKYNVLKMIYSKGGDQAIEEKLNEVSKECPITKKNIPKKFFKR